MEGPKTPMHVVLTISACARAEARWVLRCYSIDLFRRDVSPAKYQQAPPEWHEAVPR